MSVKDIAGLFPFFVCFSYSQLQKMSYSLKNQKKYTQKLEKPSKVLLVCVYDTIVLEITNEILRAKFDKFGPITKSLIFQKGEVTKFFVEYDDMESAVKVQINILQAKQQLDGTKLCQTICKMTIYYSNFTNVDLKHQASETVEYAPYLNDVKAVRTYESEYEDYTKGSNRDKQLFSEFFDDDDQTYKSLRGFNNFQRSKTDNPKTLQEEISKLSLKDEGSLIIQQQDEMDHSIKKSIDSILGGSFVEGGDKRLEDDTNLRMKDSTDVRSSVLWFSYRYSLEPHMIYNLFSNFGNISCITIKKDHVYIKFRTKEFAAIASTYLNNMVLSKNIMSLRECPQSSESWKPSEGESCRCVYYDFTFDRFTPQRSITINPPSQTLHVSSIKREICKQNSLRNIFDEFGQVEKVHILQQSSQKNMALVRFRNVEHSFDAIANLHNQSFSGRKMQISFTKSKV